MNFVNERVIDLHVLHGERRTPARLYVRFAVQGPGVYLRLEEGSREVFEVHALRVEPDSGPPREQVPATFLDALSKGLLPILPTGTTLEVTHLVEQWPSDQTSDAMELTERISSSKIIDNSLAAFEISFRSAGEQIVFRDEEDIGFLFDQIYTVTKQAFRICGYCRFARIMGYGGDDLRHGLYCFRDNPEAEAQVRGCTDPVRWAELAWSNVDTFHVCPRFQPAEHLTEPASAQ